MTDPEHGSAAKLRPAHQARARAVAGPPRDPVVVLNLDAEHELADPADHHPSSAMRRQVRDRARPLLDAIRAVHGDAFVLDLDRGAPPPGRPGLAWCPTPSAVRRLRDAGAVLADAPLLAVLQRVNHRAFVVHAALASALPGAQLVESTPHALDVVSRPPPPPTADRPWLLKRAFGFAGRWRRLVAPGRLTAADRTWITASLEGGAYGLGLCIEPLVARTRDWAMHGWIEPDGHTLLGPLRAVDVDARGRWLGSASGTALDETSGVAAELEATARRAARALHEAGYHGPFGLDAFHWRGADSGREVLQPCCDLNARFTMDWWAAWRTR